MEKSIIESGQDTTDNLSDVAQAKEDINISNSPENDSSSAESIKKLEEQVNALKDQLLREKAENENTRKRFIKELEETNKYAISNFAYDLIEVLENIYRAMENLPQDEIDKNSSLKIYFEGVEMTQKLLLSSFEKYGITRILPINETFDHNYHQAISQIVANDKAPNTIVHVIKAGYLIKGRLLSPALVSVAKLADEPKDENNS